jgi:hypothetical protein
MQILIVRTVDELDRLEHTARRVTLPDFAEAALTERFDEAIAGDRLEIDLFSRTHPLIAWAKGECGGAIIRVQLGIS